MVRKIQLQNCDKTVIVDDEDHDRLASFKWFLHKRSGYARGRVGSGERVWLHRHVINVTDPLVEVDHKDQNRLNNTKRNLRACTKRQNARNRNKRSDSARKFKGVVYDRGRWRASIKYNGKRHWLGPFESEEEAARAYDKEASANFGKFAKLNFPITEETDCATTQLLASPNLPHPEPRYQGGDAAGDSAEGLRRHSPGAVQAETPGLEARQPGT